MSKSRSYRIFVGAFPSGQLAEQLQELRKSYDPKTAAISDPHVTLAGTYWRSGQPTVQNEATTIIELQKTCINQPGLVLRLGGVRAFSTTRNPVIYLAVEATLELLAIRRRLVAVIGHDKHSRFTPHLTLAMRLKGNAAHTMLQELQGSEWDVNPWLAPVNNLYLMLRGPKDPAWRSIARLPLQQSTS